MRLTISGFLLLLLALVVLVSSVRVVPSSIRVEDEQQQQQYNVVAGVPPQDDIFVQQNVQLLRRRLQNSEDDNNSTVTATATATATSMSPPTHKIVSLPLLDKLPTDLYSGLLKASEDGDKNFFYWLVAPEDDATKASAPLLIWLNGGPGCSSSDGFFLEHGPLKFVKDENTQEWKLAPNEYSWHKAPAWVLYVDQPVGTGLSYTRSKSNYPKNDDEVNVDFHYFLEEFFLFHRDKFMGDDGTDKVKNQIYFSGESHAGHYIPSMMDYILKKTDGRVSMVLGGAAIGNGWIDPYNQYGVGDMAYGRGFIDLAQKSFLWKKEKECQLQISNGNYNFAGCYQLLDTIVDQSYGGDQTQTIASMYDVTKAEKRGVPRSFPIGHNLIEFYLGGEKGAYPGDLPSVDFHDVLVAIHAMETLEVGQLYKECTDPPYFALQHQDGLGVTAQISTLLENNIPMLFFNGMNDLICNHMGTEKALMKLTWSKIKDWTTAVRATWGTAAPDLQPEAYVQQYQNLMYLKIPNSGHMVANDQPQFALAMMKQFLRSQSFQENVSVQTIGKDTAQIEALTC